MLKQDIAHKIVEFEDSKPEDEAHELEQLKITLNKTLSRLENYMPNTNTYAGALVDAQWSDLIDNVTTLLNYVDHSDERNRPIEWFVDDINQNIDIEAEHIRQESF